MLNDALPFLAGITDIPMTALTMVALTGIPFLVVGGLTSRWSLRALYGAAILALLGALIRSAAPPTAMNPAAGVALVIATVAVFSIAIVVWGGRSAWSWIVAALAYQGLGGLRTAAYAPVWQARVSGVLTVLVVSALIALIARQAARQGKEPEPTLTQTEI
jgi:hypothetical protein